MLPDCCQARASALGTGRKKFPTHVVRLCLNNMHNGTIAQRDTRLDRDSRQEVVVGREPLLAESLNVRAERVGAEPVRSGLLLGSHSGRAIRHRVRSSRLTRGHASDAPVPTMQGVDSLPSRV